MGLHLAARGRLVVGFGLDRDYPLADFLADAAVAGLAVHSLHSTWELHPSTDDDDFVVAILGWPHERSSPWPCIGKPHGIRGGEVTVQARDDPAARLCRARPSRPRLLPAAAFRGCSRSRPPSAPGHLVARLRGGA